MGVTSVGFRNNSSGSSSSTQPGNSERCLSINREQTDTGL